MNENEGQDDAGPMETLQSFTMHDAQRMVDAIHSYVHSTDQTISGELADLARQYATYCKHANERLALCSDLLRRGLRSQAIQEAEEAPELLELVDALSFDELDHWHGLVSDSGLQRFELLNSQAIQDVRTAFGNREKTTSLLRRHRQLAIAHAPLQARISVLRELLAGEADNKGWSRDLHEYELAYARNLVHKAATADQNDDTTAFRETIVRLESEPWTEGDVPHTVRNRYASLAAKCHQRFTLPSAAFALRSAISQNDHVATKRNLDSYETVAARLRDLLPNWQCDERHQPILQKSRTLLSRNAQQEKLTLFRRDLGLLRQAIADAEEEATVGYYYQQAASHGIAIPPQVNAEIAEYKYRGAERKVLNTGLLVTVLAAVVVVLALLFFFIFEIIRQRREPAGGQAFLERVCACQLANSSLHQNGTVPKVLDSAGHSL